MEVAEQKRSLLRRTNSNADFWAKIHVNCSLPFFVGFSSPKKKSSVQLGPVHFGNSENLLRKTVQHLENIGFVTSKHDHVCKSALLIHMKYKLDEYRTPS